MTRWGAQSPDDDPANAGSVGDRPSATVGDHEDDGAGFGDVDGAGDGDEPTIDRAQLAALRAAAGGQTPAVPLPSGPVADASFDDDDDATISREALAQLREARRANIEQDDDALTISRAELEAGKRSRPDEPAERPAAPKLRRDLRTTPVPATTPDGVSAESGPAVPERSKPASADARPTPDLTGLTVAAPPVTTTARGDAGPAPHPAEPELAASAPTASAPTESDPGESAPTTVSTDGYFRDASTIPYATLMSLRAAANASRPEDILPVTATPADLPDSTDAAPRTQTIRLPSPAAELSREIDDIDHDIDEIPEETLPAPVSHLQASARAAAPRVHTPASPSSAPGPSTPSARAASATKPGARVAGADGRGSQAPSPRATTAPASEHPSPDLIRGTKDPAAARSTSTSAVSVGDPASARATPETATARSTAGAAETSTAADSAHTVLAPNAARAAADSAPAGSAAANPAAARAADAPTAARAAGDSAASRTAGNPNAGDSAASPTTSDPPSSGAAADSATGTATRDAATNSAAITAAGPAIAHAALDPADATTEHAFAAISSATPPRSSASATDTSLSRDRSSTATPSSTTTQPSAATQPSTANPQTRDHRDAATRAQTVSTDAAALDPSALDPAALDPAPAAASQDTSAQAAASRSPQAARRSVFARARELLTSAPRRVVVLAGAAIVAVILAAAIALVSYFGTASSGVPMGRGETNILIVTVSSAEDAEDVAAAGGAEASSIALVGFTADGSSIAAVSLRPDTWAAIPELGEGTLSDAMAEGGATALRDTIQKSLGVRVDRTIVVTEPGLTELAATGLLSVVNPSTFTTEQFTFPDGPLTLSAGTVMAFLEADPTALPQQQALLDGVARVLADGTDDATIASLTGGVTVVPELGQDLMARLSDQLQTVGAGGIVYGAAVTSEAERGSRTVAALNGKAWQELRDAFADDDLASHLGSGSGE